MPQKSALSPIAWLFVAGSTLVAAQVRAMPPAAPEATEPPAASSELAPSTAPGSSSLPAALPPAPASAAPAPSVPAPAYAAPVYVAPAYVAPAAAAPPPNAPAAPSDAPPSPDQTAGENAWRSPSDFTFLSLEIAAAFDAAARFPEDSSARNVVEAVDSTLGAAAWIGPRQMAFGLAFERIGLGKDHYATNSEGEVLNANYAVDTFWLGARAYFSETRPAFYLSGQVGPALPEARATGTRVTTVFSAPPAPFECSDSGRVGVGFAGAAGGEFDMSRDFSLLAEAKVTAHVMSNSQAAFGGCAPGTGPAVSGAIGLRLAYRFGF